MNIDPGYLLGAVTGTWVRNPSLDTLSCLWSEGSSMWVVLGHAGPFDVFWALSGTSSCHPNCLSGYHLGQCPELANPGGISEAGIRATFACLGQRCVCLAAQQQNQRQAAWTLAEPSREKKHFEKIYKTLCVCERESGGGGVGGWRDYLVDS